MKTKNIILVIASFVLLGLTSYGQSSVPTTTTGQPIYTSSDSNYAAFAVANFNYLQLDTSIIGKKKLKYFNRDYHFWKTRLGNTSSDGNTKEYAMAMGALKNYPCTTTDSADWICEGPFFGQNTWGSYRHQIGLISAVYMNPDTQNNILIGSNTSGIWRTTDRGVTWINVTGNIRTPSLGIGNFAINPHNANEIIASTGRRTTNQHYKNYGPTLLKTIDGGATWNEMTLPSNYFAMDKNPIGKVLYHPTHVNEIYVLQSNQDGGLYKSTDGGLTFTRIFWMKEASSSGNPLILQQQTGFDFEVFKNNTIILTGSNLFGGTSQSFISKNSGATWTDLYTNTSYPVLNKYLTNLGTSKWVRLIFMGRKFFKQIILTF